MRERRDIRAIHRAAEIVQCGSLGRRCASCEVIHQGGDSPLRIRLADRGKPYSSRRKVRDCREPEGVKRVTAREDMRSCARTERNGIGHVRRDRLRDGIEPGNSPRRTDRLQERVALRDRLEMTLSRWLQSKREIIGLRKTRQIAFDGCAVSLGQEDHVIADGTMRDEIAEPFGERYAISHPSALDRPFQAMTIGKGADRKCR